MIKELKCMECGDMFKRDVDSPEYKKMLADMGIVAQQCDKCIKEWVEDETN